MASRRSKQNAEPSASQSAREESSRGPTRRTVLRWGTWGLGAAAVVGAGGVGVRGAANGAFAAGAGEPYELWADWADEPWPARRLVAAATLASNPHNTQPWSFRTYEAWPGADAGAIEVRADARRTMPVNDAREREHLVGIGCAVENLVVLAGSAGTGTQVAYRPDGESGPDVRVLLGSQAATADADLAGVIARRHTNRGPYTERAVPAELLAELARRSELDGVRVHWIAEAEPRDEVGRLLVDATAAIVADETMSIEAFSWYRGTRSQIDRHRDGLTLDCQGLDGLTAFAAKILPASSRAEGDEFWLKRTRDVHTATAATYALIAVDDPEEVGTLIRAGRVLQRLQLAATAAGLACQPMNQITEYLDTTELGIAGDRGTAAGLRTRWQAVAPADPGATILVVRTGYPQRSAGASPRRELADVLQPA